jgi:hypothetical protein
MRRELKDRPVIGILALIIDVKPTVLANHDVFRVNELISYGSVWLTQKWPRLAEHPVV